MIKLNNIVPYIIYILFLTFASLTIAIAQNNIIVHLDERIFTESEQKIIQEIADSFATGDSKKFYQLVENQISNRKNKKTKMYNQILALGFLKLSGTPNPEQGKILAELIGLGADINKKYYYKKLPKAYGHKRINQFPILDLLKSKNEFALIKYLIENVPQFDFNRKYLEGTDNKGYRIFYTGNFFSRCKYPSHINFEIPYNSGKKTIYNDSKYYKFYGEPFAKIKFHQSLCENRRELITEHLFNNYDFRKLIDKSLDLLELENYFIEKK